MKKLINAMNLIRRHRKTFGLYCLIIFSSVLGIQNNLATANDNFEIKPNFACGIYRINGRIIFNQQKFVILQGRPYTPVPFEMILDGLPIDELLARNNTLALLEVEIQQPESKTRPLRAFFRRFVGEKEYTSNPNAYNLVKTQDCL